MYRIFFICSSVNGRLGCFQVLAIVNREHSVVCVFVFVFVCLFVLSFFCLFRAAAAAHGGSQARGLIGAVVAGLYQSHSNARSEPHL